MSKDKRLNDVPIDQIPEVRDYQAVRARYDAFREKNPEYFKYLEELGEELSTARQAADKAVRARKVSCGDFELYQEATAYNAEELMQAVGRDKFLSVGGTMTTETVYGVNKARIDACIANGEIPADVAERVRTKNPRYHAPKDMVLP